MHRAEDLNISSPCANPKARVSPARIRVSIADLQRNSLGAVVGPIWIAGNGDSAFPEESWSDAPVVLLGVWIPSLRKLLTRGQAAECRFTEGPYHFTVGRTSDGEWRIACFERREGPSVANAVAEWSAEPAAFLESALAAARAILGYCDAREWWNTDTDRLREVIAPADAGA